jgi:hypothetical protein
VQQAETLAELAENGSSLFHHLPSGQRYPVAPPLCRIRQDVLL